MKNDLRRDSVSIVVLADFNISEYSLQWFAKSQILSEAEITEAFGQSGQDDSRVLLKWESMVLEITPKRLQFLGADYNAVRISQITKSIMSAKLPDNIKAIGINGEAIFHISKEHYLKRKEILFPQNLMTELWGASSFTTEIQWHNNQSIPQVHCTCKLLDLDLVQNGADISFSYNNQFPISDENLAKVYDYIMLVEEYWHKMLNIFDESLGDA